MTGICILMFALIFNLVQEAVAFMGERIDFCSTLIWELILHLPLPNDIVTNPPLWPMLS